MTARRMTGLVALIFAPMLVAGAVASARADRAQLPQFLETPSYWVPFSADLQRTDEKGRIFSGRVYRAGDGSTRFETGAGPAPAVITLIGIQNFTKRVSYHWAARTGWTSAPMEMPPFGLQPRPVKAKDFTPTAEAVEGFRLVKTFGPTMANWFAPELNMYALKRETYDCGTPGVTCRVEVFNIRVGEPPSTLFEPPAGDSPVSR